MDKKLIGDATIHAEFHDMEGGKRVNCPIYIKGKSRAIMFLLGALLHQETETVFGKYKFKFEDELALSMFCLSVCLSQFGRWS